jgi:hypothetical protein
VAVVLNKEGRKTTLQGREEQPISLVIPCRPEYISLCRLVAGVVGTRESLDEEDIADLKLVVTEAATYFLWGPGGSPSPDEQTPPQTPASLRIDFMVRPEAWEIVVSDPEHRYHAPKGGRYDLAAGTGLALVIIKALVDSVEHSDTEEAGSTVRLVKRLSPRTVEAG